MIENLKLRTFIVLLSVLGAVIYLVPNFVDLENQWWPTKTKLVYGLDIQGGLHLVLGVDVEGVLIEKTERTVRSLKVQLEERQVDLAAIEVAPDNPKQILVQLKDPSKVAEFEKLLEEYYPGTLQILESSGGEYHIRFYDSALRQYQTQVVEQAIEVIRNRIDEFGVAEPSIAAQGGNRIIVQLPGIKNAERAKELINRTARLSFALVSEEMPISEVAKLITEVETAGDYALGKDGMSYSQYIKKLNEDLKGKLPPNTAVSFEKLENAATLEAGKRPYLIRTDTELGGDQLEDAYVSPDQYGKPLVHFRFDSQGRIRMGEVTGENINKNLAIVLDDVVQSAPVIQSKITDQGTITLNQRNYQEALDEANLIATALRAGALPAALTQLEERTVGPTLGADSIRKGEIAGLVGFGLVVAFMLLYYQTLGVVANISLMLNVALLMSILTSLGATLTLPGVAGIVLTLGMAVDANVIIFERIKEEMAKGSGIRSAVKDGFGNAFSAIFDSNLTTAITSIILMYYGTGPVRGFAVTLMIGLVTSMFTAIFVSRLLIDVMVVKMGIQKVVPVKVGGAV